MIDQAFLTKLLECKTDEEVKAVCKDLTEDELIDLIYSMREATNKVFDQ